MKGVLDKAIAKLLEKVDAKIIAEVAKKLDELDKKLEKSKYCIDSVNFTITRRPSVSINFKKKSKFKN